LLSLFVRARDSPFHSAVSPLVHSTPHVLPDLTHGLQLASTASNAILALDPHFAQTRYKTTPLRKSKQREEPPRHQTSIKQPDSRSRDLPKPPHKLDREPKKLSASPRDIAPLGQSSWAMIDLFCFCNALAQPRGRTWTSVQEAKTRCVVDWTMLMIGCT
jgi:hypothetical protein